MKINRIPWLVVFLVLLLSWWLRILYIEPQELAIICESGVSDLACTLRKSLQGIFYDNAVGFSVFAIALGAVFLRSGWLAYVATVLGMAGIVIHGGSHTGVEFCALGFTFAVLLLSKPQQNA